MKLTLFAAALAALSAAPALAQTIAPLPLSQPWMSTDVQDAWAQGYQCKGVDIVIVDDFASRTAYAGNIGLGQKTVRYGTWVQSIAKAIAPAARVAAHNYTSGSAVSLIKGLNVLNLSYGM